MIPVTTCKGQTIALFGLGGSGLATAQALIAGGARVHAFDDNPDRVSQAAKSGVTTADFRELDFATVYALVLAPGVPLTHPKPHWCVELANDANVPIIGDIELFANERNTSAPNSNLVAITGTNGKSTTTALVAHIFSHCGRDVEMGGNIGRAVLTLDEMSNETNYVVECSSYQIDLAPSINPDIGILLNLSSDHLDRHGSMENYAEIKSRLVAGSVRVAIGVDDAYCQKIADCLESDGKEVFRISVKGPVKCGVYSNGEKLISNIDGNETEVAGLEGIASLRGSHNLQNSAAAWIACHLSGLSNEEIQSGLNSFPGLAHRMEVIGSIGHTSFVNDSKATNAESSSMALGSFKNIYWIAGGLAKDAGIEPLRSHFPDVAKAYLVGEAAPEFAAALGNEVAYEISGTIEAAVRHAAKDAGDAKGDSNVVLLSPACASFDQFPNFEARGEAFREAVTRLDGLVPYGETQKW